MGRWRGVLERGPFNQPNDAVEAKGGGECHGRPEGEVDEISGCEGEGGGGEGGCAPLELPAQTRHLSPRIRSGSNLSEVGQHCCPIFGLMLLTSARRGNERGGPFLSNAINNATK